MDIVSKTKNFIKVGNSFAVIVDRSFVDRYFDGGKAPITMDLDVEQRKVSFSPAQNATGSTQNKKLTKTQKTAVLESKLSKEFRDWVEKSLDEDEQALKELAHL